MLNYKHLHYFWMVAKEGGIGRASEVLHLTPQTISSQIAQLENQFGKILFSRSGRSLELNETGRLVFGYADEMFSLGGELEEVLRDLPEGRTPVFRVGIAEVVPKSIAYRVLAPALDMPESVNMRCREGTVTSLLAELAVHRIDIIIADSPMPTGLSVRGYNHLLGECGLTFFAAPDLAAELQGEFPQNLDGAPFLLPGEATEIRGRLLRWFDHQRVRPRFAGEFDDSALMKAFGRGGVGVFVAPTPIGDEVEEQYGVKALGSTQQVKDYFYAISAERKISHPAVSRVTEAARDWLVS